MGSQSVVVDVRIPAAIMVGERPKPFGEALGFDPITSTLIFGEYGAVLVDAMMRWLRPRLSQNYRGWANTPNSGGRYSGHRRR